MDLQQPQPGARMRTGQLSGGGGGGRGGGGGGGGWGGRGGGEGWGGGREYHLCSRAKMEHKGSDCRPTSIS